MSVAECVITNVSQEPEYCSVGTYGVSSRMVTGRGRIRATIEIVSEHCDLRPGVTYSLVPIGGVIRAPVLTPEKTPKPAPTLLKPSGEISGTW